MDSHAAHVGYTTSNRTTSTQYTTEQLLSLNPVAASKVRKEVEIQGDLNAVIAEVGSETPNIEDLHDLTLDKSAQGTDGNKGKQKKFVSVQGNTDAGTDLVDTNEIDAAGNVLPSDAPEKIKKKKKKSSGKNKKPPVTGFEEYYCDPPITPQEYSEELNDIYHHSRSFVERIELCIQRYRARRKLDSTRSNYFTKYLALGGIETGLKAFGGGLDKDTIENSNAAEIAQIQAVDYISRSGTKYSKYYDPANAEDWAVDFPGVVKGFLSNRAPRIFGNDSKEVIDEYCGVIRNFLKYILYHSVCPEYTMEILEAQRICNLAQTELLAIRQASKVLPGNYNKAVSTLTGGHYENLYISNIKWTKDFGDTPPPGMSIDEAERIFKTAITLVGTSEQFDAVLERKTMPRLIKSEARFLEVVGIIFPDDMMKYRFSRVKDIHGDIGRIQPLGVLQVKNWNNPEAGNEDLTVEEEAELDTARANPVDTPVEEFWLEELILEECFIGMKFGATVRELDIGVKYFDTMMGVYCSFFTYLPNECMVDWKTPRPNMRSPPTVDNPETQEDVSCAEDFD